MTEREMLELAAKAAGVEGNYFESEAGICIHTGIYRPGLDYYWNPLISDSEALRLAVALSITIEFDGCYVYANDTGLELPDDAGAAAEVVRLAIVMAAAEIGRAMP